MYLEEEKRGCGDEIWTGVVQVVSHSLHQGEDVAGSGPEETMTEGSWLEESSGEQMPSQGGALPPTAEPRASVSVTVVTRKPGAESCVEISRECLRAGPQHLGKEQMSITGRLWVRRKCLGRGHQ